MPKLSAIVALLFAAASAHAALRSSADYAMTTEAMDSGGLHAASARYASDGSASSFAGTATGATQSARMGYVAQLYDVSGMALSSTAPSVNENASLQLGAWLVLDDSTFLPLAANAVAWSTDSGPIASISTAGVATAATVYQNASATVRADFGSYSATLGVTVLNVNTDDLGSYAGDGLPDDWQVQYFGQDNPLAAPGVDASGTGQTNLFKYLAGLNPLDPTARFTVAVESVAGQSTQYRIVFQPCFAGRTYLVEAASQLGAWSSLGSATTQTGTTFSLVDTTNDTGRSYRVTITKP